MRQAFRPAAARAAKLTAVALLLTPVALRGQAGPPPALSKSDLVRITVSSAYTTQEKIGIVRVSCLSFEPTAGDWSDLRALGADDRLLAAVEECDRAGPVAEASLSRSRLAARTGGATTVTVSLTRAGRPDAGVPVRLEGSGTAASGRLSAVTDAQGRARFDVPAGRRSGRGIWQLSAERRDLRGDLRIEATTIAGPASTATVEPERLVVGPGTTEPPLLRVTSADAYGNLVPGAEVVLWDTDRGEPLAVDSTDTAGMALLEVPVEAASRSDAQTWEIRSGGVVLATLPVEPPSLEPDAGAAAGEVFVAGALIAQGATEDGLENAAAEVEPDPLAEAGPTTTPPPDPVDRQVEAGYAALAEGNAEAAEESFRAALGLAPRRADAQRGLAAAALAQGHPEEAILWYEVAVRQEPGDAGAWAELGRAYAEAGRRDEARDALARARELDPDREGLEVEIADLGRTPGFVEGSAWGGGTLNADAGGGLRRAELIVNPSSVIQLRGGWDKSLAHRSPELIRGPDEWNTAFGGASLAWGPDRRFTTAFDLGQRKQSFGPGSNLAQNVFRLEQRARLSGGARSVVVSLGGFLGRWFDRDDWIVFGGLRAPVGERIDLLTSLSYGETVGTNWVETGRHADDDGRLYAGIDYHRRAGLSIRPSIGVGRVSSDREGLSGTLLDFLLDVRIPVTRESGVLLFARHQRPPGTEAFTVLAGGLTLHLGWGGG